jgi:DNA-binding NtrC family response regulator
MEEGGPTVLVVEPEELIRNLARDLLCLNGYRVLEAGDLESALQLCREAAAPIALVIADVVTPGGGAAVVEQVQRVCPGLRVVVMSGYHPETILTGNHPAAGFIQKPFTPRALIDTVRGLLQPRTLGTE